MKANKVATYKLLWWESIVYCFIYALVYLLSLLPLCIHYLIADALYCLLYWIIGYRKKLVRKNISLSFPDKSEKEIISIEKGFYLFLCDYLAETVKMFSMSEKQMRRRVKFEGLDTMTDALKEGKSVTIFLGHYCNWEWITSVRLYMPEEIFGGQVYHILENRIFDKLFVHLRSRWGTENVPVADILRKRVECKQTGRLMIMGYMADQVPFWNNIHLWTRFLNHENTPVFTGAEKLTKRFNDVAVYFDVERPKRGYYIVRITRLTEGDSKDIPDFEITEKYTRALEKTILRQPELWLWSHNRWKRTREQYENWAKR